MFKCSVLDYTRLSATISIEQCVDWLLIVCYREISKITLGLSTELLKLGHV